MAAAFEYASLRGIPSRFCFSSSVSVTAGSDGILIIGGGGTLDHWPCFRKDDFDIFIGNVCRRGACAALGPMHAVRLTCAWGCCCCWNSSPGGIGCMIFGGGYDVNAFGGGCIIGT